MNIAVFGLGYVGCVSAACLADREHQVVGVDVDPHKVALVAKGEASVIEPGLDDLLASVVKRGLLRATTDTADAVRGCDVSLVCVGTPSLLNGSLDVTAILRVMEQIGEALSQSDRYHVIAVRSTLLPGFLDTLIGVIERSSGRTVGAEIGLCVNPEFLREGTAISDFQTPPFTVIGSSDARSGDLVEGLYAGIAAPVYRVNARSASMVKYASNAYHALKVSFANEMGVLCSALGIDSHEVMGVFVQDRRLNVSAAYLRPGFAFGGSCLPKDLRALLYAAKTNDVEVPVLRSVLPSNDLHIQRVVDTLTALEYRDVALLGLSFKPGTDDLRESPLVRLAEALIGKGFRLSIYDSDVSMSNVFGRNRAYIERVLPHISDLLKTDLDQVVGGAQVVIIGKRSEAADKVRSQVRADQRVIDLTRGEQGQPLRAAGVLAS
jgi:GDP-mannose 6-dehydrogenase